MSEEALQIAVKRREAKSKGEKERYKHLNAEFQRMARRDKKAFLGDQCKEIEENNRRLYTWTSPDGQYQNQIDYILCSQRWRSSIQSAKTRTGADCGSDHELLIAKLRLNLKKVGKTT